VSLVCVGHSLTAVLLLVLLLLQHWGETIRNFLLFLFFGYFGGRSSTSRLVMLLGAPLCFILQARPVKMYAKILFYLMSDPPSFVKSLLPAPQQALLDLDMTKSYAALYQTEQEKSYAALYQTEQEKAEAAAAKSQAALEKEEEKQDEEEEESDSEEELEGEEESGSEDESEEDDDEDEQD
jgi:hypothetical protein